MSDKEIERKRYDVVAENLLKTKNKEKLLEDYLSFSPLYLRAPYIQFQSLLQNNLNPHMTVLEIAAGTGGATSFAVNSGAKVIGTDLSEKSVRFLNQAFAEFSNFSAIVADMETLPFDDEQFDLIFCAGALSYGDNENTKNEIYRVLKNGGKFLCVDSLNDNWIYRLNRYLRYKQGLRTKSTLKRMPNLKLLGSYQALYENVYITYHGAISWLCPLLNIFLGLQLTASFSDWFDKRIKVKGSGFKFTMIATKK